MFQEAPNEHRQQWWDRLMSDRASHLRGSMSREDVEAIMLILSAEAGSALLVSNKWLWDDILKDVFRSALISILAVDYDPIHLGC